MTCAITALCWWVFWIGINSTLKSFWIEFLEGFLTVLCHNELKPLHSAGAACEALTVQLLQVDIHVDIGME